MIDVAIGFLFKGQVNIKPDGLSACLGSPFIACLHDAGASAGDDRVTGFDQEFSCLFRRVIIGMQRCGCAKNRIC